MLCNMLLCYEILLNKHLDHKIQQNNTDVD